MNLKLIKLEPDAIIPDEEVIAINKQGYVLVGYLSERKNNPGYKCCSENEMLYDVIHYVLIPTVKELNSN